MLLAAKMAGALQAALDLSIEYTRQRQQFGKPLASFQAIQQQLAVFAEETAAANMAAAAAFRAADLIREEGGRRLVRDRLRQAARQPGGTHFRRASPIRCTARWGSLRNTVCST